MFCSNCGAKLDDSAAFCGECGTRVSVETSPVVMGEEVKDASDAKENSVKKKKGGKGRIFAVIFVALLLLMAAGVGIWYFTGDTYTSRKNMKKAEAAFAEQEFEDAQEYYKSALECDDTLKDAYVKSAEIDVQKGKFESAIKTLQKGLKKTKDIEGATQEITNKLEETYMAAMDEKVKTAAYAEALELADEAIVSLNTDKLGQKKEEIYNHMITAKLAESDYYGAISVAGQAYSATANKAFADKRVDIYISMAKNAMDHNDVYTAVSYLDDGYNDTNSQKLIDAKVSMLNEWIDSALAEKEYETAITFADEAAYLTEDDTFKERKTSIYLEWADSYLEKEDYVAALEVLNKGFHSTEAEEISAKIEEINSKRIVLSKKVVDTQLGNSVKTYYDDKGLETEVAYYDENGALTEKRTFAYDADGNLSEVAVYDKEENLTAKTLYEWADVEGEKHCVVTYLDGQERMTMREEMDEEGNSLTYTEYDVEEDTVSIHRSYEYDEKGNLVAEVIESGNKSVVNKYEHTYDDAGNLVESVTLNQNGKVMRRDTFDVEHNSQESLTYDTKGKVISTEQSTYDDKGNCLTYMIVSKDYNYHVTNTYDEEGKLIHYQHIDDTNRDETVILYINIQEDNVVTDETITYFNHEEVDYEKRVSEYDDRGNLVCAKVMNKEGLISSMYCVEYDETGNEVYILSEYDGMKEEYTIVYEYGFIK